jgi:hypothetical protein
MKLKVALPIILTATVVIGTPAVATASTPTYYLSIQPAEILFVEIAVSQGNVSAELYNDTLTESPPNLSLDTQQTTLTGTDSAGRLTLYGELGNTLFGSINGQALDLDVPETNGGLKTVTLHQASVSAYNNVLSQWQGSVSAANTAANKVTNVVSAITTAPIGTSSGIANHEEDIDLDVQKVSAAQSINDQMSPDCSSIMSTYYYADLSYPQAVSLVSDAKSQLAPDLQTVQQALGHAPAAWAAFWRAQSALPRYPFNPIPPLRTVLANGQNLMLSAVSHVNSDIDQANNYLTQAYSLVNTPNETHHCGPLQVAPALDHITLTWLLSNSTLTQVLTPSLAQYNKLISEWHRWVSAGNVTDAELATITSPNYLAFAKGSLASGLQSVQGGLSGVTQDEALWPPPCAARGSCPGLTCQYIGIASNDAHGVYSAALSMVSDAKSGSPYERIPGLTADIKAEQRAMATAPTDWAAYWRARYTLPTYATANPPPPLKEALAAGDSVIAGIVSTVNSYIDKANPYIVQAYAIVNAATDKYHCGPSQTVPVVPNVTVQSLLAK